MKLIKDFRQRCIGEYPMLIESKECLPKRFYDWWVFEEGDLDFIPEASFFSKFGSWSAVRTERQNHACADDHALIVSKFYPV